MEQITLTKQELAEIVQQEISKRLDGRNRISSGSVSYTHLTLPTKA